jgi:hypothetical protein
VIVDATPTSATVVLIDTNAIIEAVRTGTWNALTGAMLMETVEECVSEAGRGESTNPAYVSVGVRDLERLKRIHRVTDNDRARHLIRDPDAMRMDAGERDLFAHACFREHRGDLLWVICSPDKASIRAAVRLGWADQLVSLERIATEVGAQPKRAFKPHFEERFLSRYRTEYLLG